MVVVGSLACVSVAQGQIIEEGGFPVKGGGVSGESFVLSCPSRLVVEAGTSIVFSCSEPRGSGRAPLPESVEWNTLRSDIGAAGDTDRATTSRALVRKP